MLDKMKYTNHLGEVINFGIDGILIDANDFRDYEWNYNSRFKKIIGFEREISSKTLPILIVGDNAKTKANQIHEIIEKDIHAEEHGTIEINGYKMKGFFISSSKKSYSYNGMIKIELSFVSDEPYWIKETIHSFTTGVKGSGGLNFPHNFEYDFADSLYISSINNEDYVESAFRIVFKGKIVDPVIYIAGHKYQVYGVVEEGNQIIVDSLNKKIYLKKSDGSIENKFNSRDKNSDIFKEIPSGSSAVSWETVFPFDIVLIEKRSEPKWI